MDTKTKAPVSKKIKKEPGISCLVCDERFEKISARDAHLQAMHRPTIADYGCATCHEQFTDMEENTSHNEWHWKNHVPHKCAICNATFPKLISFQSHLLACVHPSFASTTDFAGNIFCGNCNSEYETQNLYDWHACFIGDNSRCPLCQRIFIKRAVLLKHMFKCTGPLPGTAAATAPTPPKKVAKGKAKKKTAKPVQKTKNKLDVPAQNSFKFEPETIIEQNVDGDDDAFDAVDNSFMDTHFADSDTEFEPSNSIITSTGLDMTNSPAKEMEHDNETINPTESQAPAIITSITSPGVRPIIELPLLECRVKLEPLDVASFVPPAVPVNPEPTPIVKPSQRPLTVPPLTIRIKKEVVRPGYDDEFDANLARNVKQERVDETYELAGGSTSAHRPHSNVHKKAKHRDKEKKLYKKPALLAIKIKQERMEREENADGEYGESYPNYSMPSDDYPMSLEVGGAATSAYENNPLPIITQIHSVIGADISAATESSLHLPVPQITIKPTHNIVPFVPIRIKSEFQKPLSPPPIDAIDSTSIPQNPDCDVQQQHDIENPPDSEGSRLQSETAEKSDNGQLPEMETQPYSEQHPETEPKSDNEKVPNNEQQSDETIDSTVAFESSDIDMGNECKQAELKVDDHEYDSKVLENNEIIGQSQQMECDTSSSYNGDIQVMANMQSDETVDSTAQNDNELNENQANAVISEQNSNSQSCSSAIEDPSIPDEITEKEETLSQIKTVSETQPDENAFSEKRAFEKDMENIESTNEMDHIVERTSSHCVDGDGDGDINMDIDIGVGKEQELVENFTNMKHNEDTGILQPTSEMCDVNNVLVTNENSNISPIDFIENTNECDDSLNFIDQLVTEVADEMTEANNDEVNKVMIHDSNVASLESSNVSFVTTEFNYNVGCSIKSVEPSEHNESNAQTVVEAQKSAANDALLALSDIPDIDCDLLPVLSANERTSNESKLNACPSQPSPLPMNDNESGASCVAAVAPDGGGSCSGSGNEIDTNAILNADANIQNEQPNLPLN